MGNVENKVPETDREMETKINRLSVLVRFLSTWHKPRYTCGK